MKETLDMLNSFLRLAESRAHELRSRSTGCGEITQAHVDNILTCIESARESAMIVISRK